MVERGRGLLRVSRQVWVLGTVSLLNDMSSEAIYPVLPFFITQMLGANRAVLGLIEGAAESLGSLLKVVFGHLSDRVGRRRRFVFIGYTLSAFSKPLFAFTTHWGQVLGVRVADRAGKGVRTAPRDALIAEAAPEGFRGRSYGVHRSLDTLGAILGPLLALNVLSLVPAEAGGYRTLFLVAALPALAALPLIPLFVHEARSHPRAGARAIGIAKLGREARLFLGVAGLFALANFSYVFLLLRSEELGIPLPLIPLLYLLFNGVYAAAATPVGALADRWGKRRMVAAGYLTFALTALGFALAAGPIYALALMALYGLFQAVNETVSRAYMTELAEPGVRATALGAYHTVVGLLSLPASLVAGALWDLYGSWAAFTLAGALALLAALLLLALAAGRWKD